MLSIFKKFLGTKSEKDIKGITPILNKIKAVYPEIEKLSNDDLRAKTDYFKKQIADAVTDKENQIAAIRERIESEPDMDMDEKEKLYEQIDHLEKDAYNITQEVLNDILPEAFAVIKETARRFKENEVIEVTATQSDRDLAATRAHVQIVDNKAYYHNRWTAGGNMITWDMVHYDVQLIGGIVLHQGRIAEMATGEGKTLVATLPVYLNALPGKGVHVVTVNDYLAKRDSEWMGVLYEFHGLKVDTIDKHRQLGSPPQRLSGRYYLRHQQ